MLVTSVSRSESTATLDLFRLRVPNSNSRRTSMIKVATLGLPFVDDDCRIARLDIHPVFVKNLVIHKNRLLYNASVDTKPFLNTKSDSIIFVDLTVSKRREYDYISFVVHSSTLLRLTPPFHSHGSVPDVVPWESWGPAATRWFECPLFAGGGPVTCGYRCLVKPQISSPEWAPWELYDFNPYRVRSLGKGFAAENETSRLTVEAKPSCARFLSIKQGIYC
jgi:hypothetical protein